MEKQNYDLSVIIPCHNLENYIYPMLRSLEEQQFEDYKIELIFICDACTDKTKSMIMRSLYNLLHYAAVHVIEVNFHCLGSTRNIGIDLATGKYIMFLDGDDWLVNNKAFDICITVLNQNQNYKLLRFKWNSNETFRIQCKCNNDNELNNKIYHTVWQYCYTKELIGDTKFPDKQPGEDTDFSELIFNKINSYIWIDSILYFYNFGRPGSNMQQFFEKQSLNKTGEEEK